MKVDGIPTGVIGQLNPSLEKTERFSTGVTPSEIELSKSQGVSEVEETAQDKLEQERFLLKDVEQSISDISEYTKLQEVGLQLKLDKDSDHKVIVQLLDRENGELIRQIPSEEAVELAKHLKKVFDEIDKNRKQIAGSFLDDRA